MNKEDFQTGMDKLRGLYGEKYYPPERIATFWDAVKDLSRSDWLAVVNELIGANTYAPMLDKVRVVSAPFQARANERRKEQLSTRQVYCRVCDGSGFARAKHKVLTQEQPFHFRCPFCDSAQLRSLSHKIPLWDQATFGEFYALLGRDGGYADDPGAPQPAPATEPPPSPPSTLEKSVRRIPLNRLLNQALKDVPKGKASSPENQEPYEDL